MVVLHYNGFQKINLMPAAHITFFIFDHALIPGMFICSLVNPIKFYNSIEIKKKKTYSEFQL